MEKNLSFLNSTYLLGVLWFILNMISSVVNDVLMKLIGSRLPFAEVAFFRFLFGTLSLAPVILIIGKESLITSRITIHVLRGMILFLAINLWSWGLGIVPITTVTIMGFTIPMFVLLLAPFFLKEKVTVGLWVATISGFIGAYIVLNPHSTDFNLYSLVLVVGALMFASLDIINKMFIVKETMVGMLFYSALVTAILGAYPAYNVWVTPTSYEICMLFLLGISSNLILFFVLKAFELVNASALSPYRYLELLISAAAGYMIFNEVPHRTFYVGCIIILPASLYIAHKSDGKK